MKKSLNKTVVLFAKHALILTFLVLGVISLKAQTSNQLLADNSGYYVEKLQDLYTFNIGTKKIMVMSGDSEVQVDWHTANRACQNLNAYGYTDWRLPTETEIKFVYEHRNNIGNFTPNNGGLVSLKYFAYWTSTSSEYTPGNMIIWEFWSGFYTSKAKSQKHCARCVRSAGNTYD